MIQHIMKNKISFKGINYVLLSKKRYYLSTSTTNSGRKKPKGLHVAIWEDFNKNLVPSGYIVHHKDGNYMNNDPSNLECIPKETHFLEHRKAKIRLGKSQKQLDHLNSIREKATEWHRSVEGRKWHSEHAKKHLLKVFKPRFVICSECQKTFKTLKPTRVFCCKDCKNKRQKRLSPEIKVNCSICKNDFFTKWAYNHTRKTCSKKCRYKLMYKNGGGFQV